MLRKIRMTAALLFFVGLTLLFLDFTGTLHGWLGWMAKMQFLPALMAINVGVVIALVALTLLLGRVYCSVICPMGVLQDLFGWLGKKQKRNRYSYSAEKKALRYGVLVLFVMAMIAGIGSIVALLAPYSAYGRIANNLFAPLYGWGNNALAYMAERADSYAFYEREVWVRSCATFAIAALTFILIGTLAWRNGRTYCNTICPVGTVLGLLARFAYLKPTIDTSKCVNCKLCAKNCKAACIDTANHRIDYSRCVSCMDCIDHCHKGAIHYTHAKPQSAPATETTANNGRRGFLTATLLATASAALKAQEKKVDGGLTVLEDKQTPDRQSHIVPPGAISQRHFAQHCTACQLCVSACPKGVLRPSTDLKRLMQPEMHYEKGYCRPECTKCGEVCPAGAILPLTRVEKSATHIGHAVWVKSRCVPLTDGVECGNCARHCPTQAITMIPSEANDPKSPKIPAVNTDKCIGCGACENLCPSRPFSAIYVEGKEIHVEE